jgi:hypothetical protein
VGALSKEWILAARVDYNLSNADKMFFRIRTDRGTQPTYTDPISPVFNATSVQPQDEGQWNWTHTFSPTVLNQFVASGSYYSAIFADPTQAAATSAFGDGAGHGYSFIDEDLSAFSLLGGENYAFPQGRNVSQYQFIDDLSISRGSHSLKVGGNFRRNDITDAIFGARSVTPEMISVSQTLLDGGTIYEMAQRFPQKLEQPMSIYSFGLYFQDEYKVSNSLKLTLTLRADRNSNLNCSTGCFSYPVGGNFGGIGINNNTPYNQVMQYPSQSFVPNLEKVVFQPRFGFAWSPMGKSTTVVRGGVGLFSDLYPGTLADNFARNTPSLNSFALTFLPFSPAEPNSATSTMNACNAGYNSNYFGGGNATSFGALGIAGCTPPIINSVSPKLLNPKYLEWNFEIQQAIGNKTSFTLNYVGNHGYDEFIEDPWINAWSDATFGSGGPGSGTNTFGGLPGGNTSLGPPSFLEAPNGHFRNIVQLTNNGVSNYDGLTGTISRRFTAGFQGNFNYTWSHSMDMISNGGILPYSGNDSGLIQYNPYCLRCLNYGNSDYDVRHNVTANFVWELPFKSSNKAMNFVESGWTLSQTYFYHTGYPYSVWDAAGYATSGLHNTSSVTDLLATFNGGPMASGCSTPDTACLSPSQFAPSRGESSFGNTPRNAFRGPGYFNSDFSLLKNFPVTERVSFGLGATAYNIFNHASFSNPVQDVSSGQFGTIQQTVVPPTSPYGAFVGSSVSGRLVQVQARVTF